jgi:hypothetical protein
MRKTRPVITEAENALSAGQRACAYASGVDPTPGRSPQYRQFPGLDAQQVSGGNLSQTYEAPAPQALTSYAYLVEAINGLF